MSKVFGLHNSGSICYFNSLMQSILSCTISTEYMKSADVNGRSDVWMLVHTFICEAMLDTGDGVSVKDATPILNGIRVKYKGFGLGQEDAGECFNMLLECMNDDEYNKLYSHKYSHHINCKACGDNVSTTIDESMYVDIGSNYCEGIVKCKHGDIFTGDLNRYVIRHTVDLSDYSCPKCRCKKNITMYSRLLTAAKILIIHFNKYGGVVKCDLPPVMVFPVSTGVIKYTIVAKLEHCGSISGGHYVAHCKRGGDIPYLFNDAVIGVGNFDSSDATYICFYHI